MHTLKSYHIDQRIYVRCHENTRREMSFIIYADVIVLLSNNNVFVEEMLNTIRKVLE